jgi:hypothetical protein
MRLAARNWERADEDTRYLICSLAGAELPVRPAIIAALPEEHLQQINSLWEQHSGGAFGLRVQAKLWREVGGPARVLEFHDMSRDDRLALAEHEYRFGHLVGWAITPKADRTVDRWGWVGCSFDEATMRPGALPYQYLMCSYGCGLIGLVAAAVAARFPE